MREILFRGKSEESGEWLYGLPDDEHHNAGFPCILPDWRIHSENDVPCSWEVDPKTVGQYTGLTDKNGKKIFEGDIVRDDLGKICKVFYTTDTCSFMVLCTFAPSEYKTGVYRLGKRYCNAIAVIGNIHDNRLEDFDGD